MQVDAYCFSLEQMFVKEEFSGMMFGGRVCKMADVDDIPTGCLATCSVAMQHVYPYQLELWIMPYQSSVFSITEISVIP